MAVIRLAGVAASLFEMPPTPAGTELWCMNDTRGYRKRNPRVVEAQEWTRWFNLHPRTHMEATYPATLAWYRDQTRPIYCQQRQSDIPASRTFPRTRIQRTLASRYFTCSPAWLLAFAWCEALAGANIHRIELYGIEVANAAYAWERPCLFYWIARLQRAGMSIWWPPHLAWDIERERATDAEATSYTGPLYGYEMPGQPSAGQSMESCPHSVQTSLAAHTAWGAPPPVGAEASRGAALMRWQDGHELLKQGDPTWHARRPRHANHRRPRQRLSRQPRSTIRPG